MMKINKNVECRDAPGKKYNNFEKNKKSNNFLILFAKLEFKMKKKENIFIIDVVVSVLLSRCSQFKFQPSPKKKFDDKNMEASLEWCEKRKVLFTRRFHKNYWESLKSALQQVSFK